MVILNEEINNELYEKLLEYAYSKCDAVSFYFPYYSEKSMFKYREFLKSLEKELRERFDCSYIITKTEKSESDIYDNFPIYKTVFFKFSEELYNYLLSKKSLYKLGPRYPEDICFYKNNKCWLYSITHEKVCDIYVENIEEFNFLKSIGIEFNEEFFFETPKEHIIYEEY